jgi:hypothetical protein
MRRGLEMRRVGRGRVCCKSYSATFNLTIKYLHGSDKVSVVTGVSPITKTLAEVALGQVRAR